MKSLARPCLTAGAHAGGRSAAESAPRYLGSAGPDRSQAALQSSTVASKTTSMSDTSRAPFSIREMSCQPGLHFP